MSTPWLQTELAGFDRQQRIRARLHAPDRYRKLEQLPSDCPRIARGAGVSYVAASFDREAVSQSLAAFDRLLAFDADRGLLRVEAGADIAAVQRFALARGWYLPVAPGHPRASIGGCIAANVHGKNPARDGCFGALTGALTLFHPDRGWQQARPGDPLWQASVGGFGLTGAVVQAELQLRRAPASIRLQAHPVANLHQAAEVLARHADADLVYGWHDGRPEHFGRGLIRVGHASDEAGASALPPVRLGSRYRALPLRLWNRASLALANEVLARRWAHSRTLPLGQALLPLNDAGNYFAAFGPRGLLECQWLVPPQAFDAFATELGKRVRRQRPLLPLISSKWFDGQADGPAFDGHGVALALHLPGDAAGRRFARELTALALDHQGRPNPIKQSHLDAASLARAVPELDDWRQRVAAHNPGQRLQSELIRRLALG